MLSRADAELTRRDPALPGLATVLDPGAFLAALQGAVPGVRIRVAKIAGVRYKPGRYCRASYRVDADGASCDLDVLACRPEEVVLQLGEAVAPTVAGPLGPGRVVLRDPALIVSVFPYDAALPQVSRLSDPGGRVSLLRDLLPERPASWEGDIRLLRYVPGRRYSAELRARDGSRLLLKAHTRSGYHRARCVAEEFRSSGPLRLARLLGFSDTHRLLAFEWLPGRMLSEHCRPPGIDWEAISATGAALAWLHAQLPNGLETWTRDDESAYLVALSGEIGFLCPRVTERVAAIARRLAAWLAGAPPVQLPVHGDFSDAQVLIQGRQAAIVDLDSACCGDPADDLGSLLAQWEIRALRGELSRGQVETMVDALLDGYRRSASRSPAERLRPYLASGLLRRARFAFRARRSDWPQLIESCVDRADDILGALV